VSAVSSGLLDGTSRQARPTRDHYSFYKLSYHEFS
jgi:hypothetical protein